MNNLHISLTEFRNESRVLKETMSIAQGNIASHVYIAALHADGQKLHEKISDKISLDRIFLRSRSLPRILFLQLFKYIEFCIKILFKYKKCDIGLVNIHAVSLLPIGILLKYCYGAKLVYDTHELETEVEGLHGIQQKLIKLLEKISISQCDQIFVVSEKIADWYAETYKIRRPIVIFNSPSYREYRPTTKLRAALGIPDNATLFLYQGGLVEGRGVEIILETFQSIKDPRKAVVFMGYGHLEEKIKHASTLRNNIYFHPAVSPQDLLDYTASADVGISLIQSTCLSYLYSMPNKLFEYGMAGIPVIVSNMPEMSAYVTRFELGVVAETETSAGLLNAINQLDNSDLNILKSNAKRASKELSWEIQEQKMFAAYQALIGV